MKSVFPHPPEGKYYLVDAGYPNMKGAPLHLSRTPSPPQSPENIIPLRTIHPSSSQPPNLTQTPPHLKTKNLKKSKSSSPTRRSQRRVSGIGTKQVQNPKEKTVITCETSDEDYDPSPKSSPEGSETNPSSIHGSSSSSKSDNEEITSQKGKEKIVDDISEKHSVPKRRFKTEKRSVKGLKSQSPKPHFKSVQQCLFDFKWSRRTVAPGRFHDFKAFEKQNFKLKSYLDNQGWTTFMQMKEKYYPKLVQSFYFSAKFSPETNSLKTIVKDIEIELTPGVLSTILGIPNEGICLFGNKWYADAGTTFEEPEIVEPCDDCKLCVSNEKPCLKKYSKGKRKRVEEDFTSAEPLPNLDQIISPNVLVYEPTPKIVQDTLSSPLMFDQNENIPQNVNATQVSSFSDFMSSSACVAFHNSTQNTQTLSSPQHLNPLPFILENLGPSPQNLPFPSLFFSQTFPNLATNLPINPQFTICSSTPTFELPPFSQAAPSRGPKIKKSKEEKNFSKMRSHLKKLSHGQAILHSQLTYNAVENSYLRAWIRSEICPKFGLNLPQVNHFSPPMETIPEASKSSSSNASSPGTSYHTP
ncbi:hypothetical protein P8452_53178 [Trifolium repens]|nr:hypothetical protein P8452_53178 [Trifolium repens]